MPHSLTFTWTTDSGVHWAPEQAAHHHFDIGRLPEDTTKLEFRDRFLHWPLAGESSVAEIRRRREWVLLPTATSGAVLTIDDKPVALSGAELRKGTRLRLRPPQGATLMVEFTQVVIDEAALTRVAPRILTVTVTSHAKIRRTVTVSVGARAVTRDLPDSGAGKSSPIEFLTDVFAAGVGDFQQPDRLIRAVIPELRFQRELGDTEKKTGQLSYNVISPKQLAVRARSTYDPSVLDRILQELLHETGVQDIAEAHYEGRGTVVVIHLPGFSGVTYRTTTVP